MTAGVIRQYIACCLKLSRSQDDVLFEVRGPVGSGKTHFLLHATVEIVRRLIDDTGFRLYAQEVFDRLWSISYQPFSIPKPANWMDELI